MSNNLEYSVVVPVYNSEETIEELFNRISTVFQDLHKSYEVIFVDDGSIDNSWNVLAQLKEKHPGIITAIKLTKNYGQHNATFCSLEFAKGAAIITIDDDLQTPPEEIKKLISCYNENFSDLIYGFYAKKKHAFFRNLGSWIIKKTAMIRINAYGEGSSFRLLKHDLAKKILLHNLDFVYIDELLLWYTNDISYIKVEHLKRKSKRSGYTSIKLFKLTTNIIIFYTAIPLRIMTYGGLIVSFISLCVGIRFILRKVFFDVPLGYTSIIVSILFSTSLILFCLGIIGEYLSRLYKIQNKKPPYSIKKIS